MTILGKTLNKMEELGKQYEKDGDLDFRSIRLPMVVKSWE